MKLEQLNENAALNVWKRPMWAEFREIAAKYNLVFVLSSGWPATTSNGLWFGGGIKDSAQSDEHDLPREIRMRGFINDLEKKLASLMDEGHDISVGNGMTRQNLLVQKSDLKERLTAGVNLDFPQGSRTGSRLPCLIWKVYMKEGTPNQFLASVALFYNKPLAKPKRDHYGGLKDADLKEVRIGTLVDANLANRKKYAKIKEDLKDTFGVKAAINLEPKVVSERDIIEIFLKISGDKLKDIDVDQQIRLYYTPEKKTYPKATHLVSEDEFMNLMNSILEM